MGAGIAGGYAGEVGTTAIPCARPKGLEAPKALGDSIAIETPLGEAAGLGFELSLLKASLRLVNLP